LQDGGFKSNLNKHIDNMPIQGLCASIIHPKIQYLNPSAENNNLALLISASQNDSSNDDKQLYHSREISKNDNIDDSNSISSLLSTHLEVSSSFLSLMSYNSSDLFS
jgi:hypothetical protein